jgi:hypothetical protein
MGQSPISFFLFPADEADDSALEEFADLVLQATWKMPAGYGRSFDKLRMTRKETVPGSGARSATTLLLNRYGVIP